MPYQVGDLEHIQKDDPVVETLEQAYKEAIARSFADMPIGLWNEETGELLAIAYMLDLFIK